jgi:hypothetical protein
MKTINIDFPVIGWGSLSIEVEDDLTSDEILDMIKNDEIDIPVSKDNINDWQPIFSLDDIHAMSLLGEIPWNMEVFV